MSPTLPSETAAGAKRPSPDKHWRRRAWLLALIVPLLLGPLWCWGLWELLPRRTAAFSGLILVLMLSVSTVTDALWRKIFNWATYSAALWLVAVNAFASAATWISPASPARERLDEYLAPSPWVERLGAIGLDASLAGGAVCFLVLLMAYQLARGGAGDVKLATVLGLGLGVKQGLLAVGLSYIVAGAAILVWTIKTRGPLTLASALLRKAGSLLFPVWVAPPEREQTKLLEKPIPLAPFFAIGSFIVLLELPL